MGVDTSKEKSLSLQEAVELALRNNRDLEVERINMELSEFGLKGAEGRYDPVFSFGPSFTSRTIPIASLLGGGPNATVSSDTYFWNARLQQRFTSGANLDLFFNNSRDATNNAFNVLNPQFNNTLGFNFTQPLFRNLKIDPFRREIRISKTQTSLSSAQFRLRVIETVTGVVQSYWDLAYAYSDLEVKQETARWALSQLEINKRLAAAGTLAEVQIVEAEAELERREGDVLVAMENVNRAQNVLKQLLLPDRKDTLWSAELQAIRQSRSETELDSTRRGPAESSGFTARARADRPAGGTERDRCGLQPGSGEAPGRPAGQLFEHRPGWHPARPDQSLHRPEPAGLQSAERALTTGWTSAHPAARSGQPSSEPCRRL